MARLPSLDTLRVFSVAARHMSFTKAADELHLTQSAVSHRVRALEEELRSRLAAAPSRGLGLVQHTGGRLAASHGTVPVGALSDAAGVSGNHLATQFKSHVGVTPKRVARIYRFARLILSVDAKYPVDWTRQAQAAG